MNAQEVKVACDLCTKLLPSGCEVLPRVGIVWADGRPHHIGTVLIIAGVVLPEVASILNFGKTTPPEPAEPRGGKEPKP